MQRVTRARVTVKGEEAGRIGAGLVVLLGVARGDEAETAAKMAARIVHLRVFNDERGKINRSLRDSGGAVLAVPQFTLLADCAGGHRPSFSAAESPAEARRRFEEFVAALRPLVAQVATGVFGADMRLELENDGPVTLVLES